MSAGGQSQRQSSSSASFIDPLQQGFLSNLWTTAQQQIRPGAQGTAASAAARPGLDASSAALGGLTGQVRNPMAGLTSVLGNLNQAGSLSGNMSRSQPALTTLAGLMNPTKQIAAQSRSLKSGLGELFREELNPAIRGGAISAGGFGGGRQGVAQGQAVGELADSYTQGLGDIVASANAQAGAAAGDYGSLIQGILGQTTAAQGAAADVISNARAGQRDAASLIPGVGAARQGFGTAGSQGVIQALQALAGIYGNPAILTAAQSGGKGSGWSFGFGN